MNRHREFMRHRPPVFTHAADPLDADDWLKTLGKMLTTAQCEDMEKVLFAAGDYRDLQENGGMLTLPPMLHPTPSPGRSSQRASGTTIFLLG
jgi:hypothetical protein